MRPAPLDRLVAQLRRRLAAFEHDHDVDPAEEDVVFARIGADGAYNLTGEAIRRGGPDVDRLAACFAADAGGVDGAYHTLATFPRGAVTLRHGRSGDNVQRTLGLLLDADLKDLVAHRRGVNPADKPALDRITAELHALDDDALVPLLGELEEEVRRALFAAAIPSFSRTRTGYGFQDVVALAREDQVRPIEQIKAIHRALVDALNAVAAYDLFDAAVTDAGSRLARAACSFNRKNPDRPRPVNEIERAGTRVRLADLPRHPEEPGRIGGDQAGSDPRPGSDFNVRVSWPEVLEGHGWRRVGSRGGVTYWCRPGKDRGVSATTNYAGSDLLHVFSTSTAFEAGRSYSKFGAYTVLDHEGDFAAAARALEAQGYGHRTGSASGSGPAPTPPPLVSVPPFPLEALPPVARRFVAAGATALGCPPDFVALPLFAFCGAVAGNARKLRLKADFDVAPIFWTGVVGKPGTVKTPALNHARRPLDALQQEAWASYRTALDRWEEEKPAERGAKPRPEHYFATDTTTEAVAFALMTSRGLAVVHDELAGWVKAFDAYRKAGDRQTWLSAWSGVPLKPNRKTGEPIYVPDPVVCVIGGIQPDVLSDLAGEAARDDGFIPRLLLAWPDAEPSPWSDEVVAAAVAADMLGIVRALRLPGEERVVTTLAPAAYAEWIAWFNENRGITATSRGLAAGWAAKAPVHLARIALVLHLLAHADDHVRPLDSDTLRDAIAVAEYFRAHLGRVLPAFGAAPTGAGAGLAARVLRVLTRAHPGWVGRAELATQLGGHEPSPAVGTALASLARRGQAEDRTVRGMGRPREEWRWTEDDADRAEEGPARDKGKDVESPPQEDFPRNHVITRQLQTAPDAGWERWEEPL